jgi:flagellar hook-basal body complex protein FliE
VAPAAGAARPAPSAANDASFGELLDHLTTDAVDTLKSAESAAIAGVQGKASVQSVVDSIMSAERTLQTVIAVRDKAVSAYQEVSRMAI